LEGDWRELPAPKDGMTPKVRCNQDIWFSLVDGSGPGVLLENLTQQKSYVGDEIFEFVEIWDGICRPIDWENEGDTGVLSDGDVFVVRGHALRLHCSSEYLATKRSELVMSHSETRLDIDLPQLGAEFTLSSSALQIKGEVVRTLAVYAEARRDEHFEEGGWLTKEEAYGRWLNLGGSEKSKAERLGWDRGKIRSRLAKGGGSGLKALFETKRGNQGTRVRLGMTPDQISVEES